MPNPRQPTKPVALRGCALGSARLTPGKEYCAAPGNEITVERMRDRPTPIRPATPDDAPGIADVNVRAWRHAYRGMIPDAYLDALEPSTLTTRVGETLRRQSTILVAAPGVVVGFSWVSTSRDEDAPVGTAEVIALYVAPEHQRRGVGRALMAESLRVAALQSACRVTLWVLQANDAARDFYAALGFAPDGATKTTERWGGVPVSEVRYARALSP